MSRKKTLIAASAAAAVIVTTMFGWRTLEAQSDKPTHKIEELDQRTVQAQNRFGLRLMQQLSSESPKQNLTISPYSIQTALSMTLTGAAGETGEAMRTALQLENVPEHSLNQNALVLSDLLTHAGKSIELGSANSLWLQKDYRFVPQFLQDAKNITRPGSPASIWSHLPQ